MAPMPKYAVIPFLVAMMLLSGVCNTLLTKFQDLQCVGDCDNPDPNKRKTFEQPVIQTLQMFIGESGSWLVILAYKIVQRFSKAKEASYAPLLASDDSTAVESPEEEDAEDEHLIGADAGPSYGTTANPAVKPLLPRTGTEEQQREEIKGLALFWLAIPPICDFTGTTLMNLGLLFTAASIYQMTRGALVLFVGVFSVWFLKKRLRWWHWTALVSVVSGVAVVGLAGYIDKHREPTLGDGKGALLVAFVQDTMAANPDAVKTVVGIFLIFFAQIFTATQFVFEEKLMERYSIEALKLVAWEGIFGMLTTLIAMPIFHYAWGVHEDAPYHHMFDVREGFREVLEIRAIGISSLFIMISIGCFNYFGLSITRSVSATSRSIIDTCRTLFIWLVSLGLGWESFKWLQIPGFALLVYGTFLYNDLITPPLPRSWYERERITEGDEVLPEAPIEHL